MVLLLSGLWPGILGALVLGLGLGWVVGPPPVPAIPAGLGLATLALAGVAVAGIVPGVPGFWLESAASMLAPYLAGCALGALGRRFSGMRPGRTLAERGAGSLSRAGEGPGEGRDLSGKT